MKDSNDIRTAYLGLAAFWLSVPTQKSRLASHSLLSCLYHFQKNSTSCWLWKVPQISTSIALSECSHRAWTRLHVATRYHGLSIGESARDFRAPHDTVCQQRGHLLLSNACSRILNRYPSWLVHLTVSSPGSRILSCTTSLLTCSQAWGLLLADSREIMYVMSPPTRYVLFFCFPISPSSQYIPSHNSLQSSSVCKSRLNDEKCLPAASCVQYSRPLIQGCEPNITQWILWPL